MMYQNKLETGIVAAAALILVACGGNQLKPETKQRINSTEVRIIVKQPEIYAAVERNTFGDSSSPKNQWGAFLNSTEGKRVDYRKKRADDAMKPVVKAMKGYKVKSLAQRVYKTGLKRVTWMKPTKVKVVSREITDDEKYEITKKSKADAVLFVELDYTLTANMKGFKVSSKSILYHQKVRQPDVQPSAIYYSQHTYEWNLPNNADGLYEHRKLGKKWSQNKARVLKKKIKEGFETEVQHIVKELQKS